MSFVVSILLWLLGLIVTAVIIAAVSLIIYARWNYGSLEQLGIPVIKPHWCLGSNYNGHNVYNHLEDLERSKKYGHVYGVYDGRTPSVFVSDTKLLRRILSTDFEHFRNHRKFLDEHPVTSEVLDFLDDEKWKTIRAVLTPHFTSGKIKLMTNTVVDLAQEYVTALIKDMDGSQRIKIDFRRYSPPLVLEIIGKCFCGIDIENARDPNNEFINGLKTTLGTENYTFDWTFTYASAFPILQKLAPSFPKETMDTFEKTVRQILKSRQRLYSRIKKEDMVNTLLEIFKKAKTDPDYKRLGITEYTALSQAFEFFVASYESVRGTLSVLSYYLATEKDVQERLLEEIDSMLEKHNGKINYETVSDMPYLTACLTETFRIFPGFFRPDRRCTQDWEYEGIKIKKDMVVFIPAYTLSRHPDYYQNAEQFDPERFMPGQKEKLDPYAFGTFGQGPRACIGQRFAYEMLKIVLCHYLREFKIEKREDTVFKTAKGSPLFLEYDPILVDIVKRN